LGRCYACALAIIVSHFTCYDALRKSWSATVMIFAL
jgi:hypothetical protein